MVMPVPVPVWMITVAGPDSNHKPAWSGRKLRNAQSGTARRGKGDGTPCVTSWVLNRAGGVWVTHSWIW
jgi:hypothetical protein